ncbi:protein EARLY-RESPONSIVE TO DEHYDRATION 7, chloroplastic-like [Herrania umbratica]|uniref:Protein EARLY-RESPONSIVE TO DEHYDRATION 7, chloroplastic-like n=1 Tax=Herrania umbratica TaxID=108875 RepID=A0A6J0ZK20_9ROSI|nr:protein EARLY-RESPONSIVE TO DEHYDRATION 7, chloroplastic-like [Herrania umbratica]
MASQNPNQKSSLYPEVIQSNPDFPQYSSSNNLYPSLDMRDLVENLFPDPPNYSVNRHSGHTDSPHAPTAPPQAVEEVLIRIPGAILNLIDKSYSVELACGDFTVIRLWQGENIVAILARVAEEIQWPLMKDETAVKLDDAHYFFSLQLDKEAQNDSSDSDDDDKKGKKKTSGEGSCLLNYGLTFASKGQEYLLRELDVILQSYSCFTVQKVEKKGEEVLDGAVAAAKEMSPADLKSETKKEAMEEKCAAYWTTLAPNVEDYSGRAAKVIAAGSGHLIKGILWCGDVTMDRLNKGNEVLKKRMSPAEKNAEISPETLKRIKRVKKVTKMTQKVANGVLSGVVKVSGLVTSSVANSKVGKKFFGLLPGEIVLASLDGFNRICDAVEVAGKNVMSTSSTVTTELVNHKYGEKAAEATNEGLGAAGHAVGTAWAAFKLRQALNPKSVLKPSRLAKSAAKAAAAELKGKSSK